MKTRREIEDERSRLRGLEGRLQGLAEAELAMSLFVLDWVLWSTGKAPSAVLEEDEAQRSKVQLLDVTTHSTV